MLSGVEVQMDRIRWRQLMGMQCLTQLLGGVPQGGEAHTRA